MTRSFLALGRGFAAARLSAYGRPWWRPTMVMPVTRSFLALGRGFAAARLSAYGRPW